MSLLLGSRSRSWPADGACSLRCAFFSLPVPTMQRFHSLRALSEPLMTADAHSAQVLVRPCASSWALPAAGAKGSLLCTIYLGSQAGAQRHTPIDRWASHCLLPILSCVHLQRLPAGLEPRAFFCSPVISLRLGLAEHPGKCLRSSLLTRLFFPFYRRPRGLGALGLSTIFEDLTAPHRSTSHGPAPPGNLS